MSDTWLTLQIARDAWDSGRLRESWQLMDRVEVDFEYMGRSTEERPWRAGLFADPSDALYWRYSSGNRVCIVASPSVPRDRIYLVSRTPMVLQFTQERR